jgi:hypothetical protein
VVPRFFFVRRWLFGRWLFALCFLIVARLAEFNFLLPDFPALYFSIPLFLDSLL